MTVEEAIIILKNEIECVNRECGIEKQCGNCNLAMPCKNVIVQAYELAIQALEEKKWTDDYAKAIENAVENAVLSIDPRYDGFTLEELPPIEVIKAFSRSKAKGKE